MMCLTNGFWLHLGFWLNFWLSFGEISERSANFNSLICLTPMVKGKNDMSLLPIR